MVGLGPHGRRQDWKHPLWDSSRMNAEGKTTASRPLSFATHFCLALRQKTAQQLRRRLGPTTSTAATPVPPAPPHPRGGSKGNDGGPRRPPWSAPSPPAAADVASEELVCPYMQASIGPTKIVRSRAAGTPPAVVRFSTRKRSLASISRTFVSNSPVKFAENCRNSQTTNFNTWNYVALAYDPYRFLCKDSLRWKQSKLRY